MSRPHIQARKQKTIDRLLELGVPIKGIPPLDVFLGKRDILNLTCSCGVTVTRSVGSLLKAKRPLHCRSCASAGINVKWLAPHWFQKRFAAIVDRCTKPEHRYFDRYGGRGICCEFETPDEMFNYMHTLPNFSRDLEIDRTDNNGNYTVGNLRWATRKEQVRNQNRCKHNTRILDMLPKTTYSRTSIQRFMYEQNLTDEQILQRAKKNGKLI